MEDDTSMSMSMTMNTWSTYKVTILVSATIYFICYDSKCIFQTSLTTFDNNFNCLYLV